MAQQDKINSDVTAIADALTTIATELQSERDALANANPAADLSGLDAVAQKAKDLAASATPAAPAAPAATDTPAPAAADAPAPAVDSASQTAAVTPETVPTDGTNPAPVIP